MFKADEIVIATTQNSWKQHSLDAITSAVATYPWPRDQLRIAHHMFDEMGIRGFAQRAERELSATGKTASKRARADGVRLTSQEAQVARLAGDGLTNSEIGARLFVSHRTVQYHLRNVFTKLSIRSRSQLQQALTGSTGSSIRRERSHVDQGSLG